jgi:hypothetical protein
MFDDEMSDVLASEDASALWQHLDDGCDGADHAHGHVNARLGQHGGVLFGAHDSAGGYYGNGAITCAQDPATTTEPVRDT